MRLLAALLLALLLLAPGCARTKHDLLEASMDAGTRDELKEALGAPDDRQKMGPVEIWTYEASDGSLTFLITGQTVQLQTSSPDRQEAQP